MPSLVCEIFTSILLGPTLVPFPTSFVMLGETGLILLVIEVGVDIGLTTEATVRHGLASRPHPRRPRTTSPRPQ